MKKQISIALLLLLVIVASSFFLLPPVQKLERTLYLRVNARALHRAMLQQSLPAQQKGNFSSKTEGPRLLPGLDNSFLLQVPDNNGLHNSQIRLLGISTDSSAVYWNGVVRGGNLPWQRWTTWRKSHKIEQAATEYLQQLKQLENEEALYGFKVNYEKVKDSVMVATRFSTAAYPTTGELYQHINQLRQYIATQNAQATNHPMIHVQPTEGGYQTQIAVPTNRLLPEQGPIFFRRMVMGNILQAEIKGGQATVEKGLRQLEHYVNDHELISPAIPFASLVTDRMQVPDSSRWVTKIFYPIY